jgi:hypothetical protein
MKTFGDYEEWVNIPGGPRQFRCGICDRAFANARERGTHHKLSGEEMYEYHKPKHAKGALCYLVDVEGFRVTARGRRY